MYLFFVIFYRCVSCFCEAKTGKQYAKNTKSHKNQIIVSHAVNKNIVSSFYIVRYDIPQFAAHKSVEKSRGQNDSQILSEIAYQGIHTSADTQLVLWTGGHDERIVGGLEKRLADSSERQKSRTDNDCRVIVEVSRLLFLLMVIVREKQGVLES